MALNFPSSPTDQQVYTDSVSGNQYVYYSTPGVWKSIKTTPVATTSIGETVDAFTGNGSAVAYTLSVSSTTNNSIVTISGVTQDPTSAYTISGTALTFSAAPANGSTIRVRTPQAINAYGNASTLANFYFLATAGQTTFSGADQNSNTLGYTAGLETVYVNGSKLVRGVDYTAADGTSVTLLIAAALNDVIEIISYQNFTFVSQPSSALTSLTVNSLIYETAATLTTASTAQVNLDTLDGSTYRSAKYLIQCTDNTDNRYHVVEALLVHNYPSGSSAYLMPYGSTYSSASLFTMDASVSGSSIYLQVTPTVSNSTFKLYRTAVVA